MYVHSVVGVKWNLRTKDTLGLIVLSLVERLSLSQRLIIRASVDALYVYTVGTARVKSHVIRVQDDF